MLTVPAFVWRGGAIGRGAVVGLGTGIFLGLLAWLDSGLWFAGLLAGAIITVIYGIWLGWRMAKHWPAPRR